MSRDVTIRVMSFNLRNAGAGDGENCWDNRRNLIIDMIRAADVDLLGTQECLAIQGDFLRSRLNDYEMVGAYRDDGGRRGEASALLFKRNRFDRLDSGTFWLCDTPDAVGAKGWDAQLPRVCSWARLRDRASSRELLFINTHFDHRGVIARSESARQVCRWITDNGSDLPAILTGDFNANPDSEPYALLAQSGLRDAWRVAHPSPITEEGTYHAFTGTRTRERIDWIFCSAHFDVLHCQLDYTTRAGLWPSDHFPLFADLQLR